MKEKGSSQMIAIVNHNGRSLNLNQNRKVYLTITKDTKTKTLGD